MLGVSPIGDEGSGPVAFRSEGDFRRMLHAVRYVERLKSKVVQNNEQNSNLPTHLVFRVSGAIVGEHYPAKAQIRNPDPTVLPEWYDESDADCYIQGINKEPLTLNKRYYGFILDEVYNGLPSALVIAAVGEATETIKKVKVGTGVGGITGAPALNSNGFGSLIEGYSSVSGTGPYTPLFSTETVALRLVPNTGNVLIEDFIYDCWDSGDTVTVGLDTLPVYLTFGGTMIAVADCEDVTLLEGFRLIHTQYHLHRSIFNAGTVPTVIEWS